MSKAASEKASRLIAATSFHNKNGIERWAATAAYALWMMDLYVPEEERLELEELTKALDALQIRAQGK